jgi:hypothetical protein
MVAARCWSSFQLLVCASLAAWPAAAQDPQSAPGQNAEPGDFGVSLRVRWAQASTGRRVALGLATVTVPLAAIAAPAPARQRRGNAARPVALHAHASADEQEPVQHPEPAQHPADAVPPEARGRSWPSGADRLALALTPELARETVRAAFVAAGLGQESRRHLSLSARARSSALLPQLRLRGGRSRDESLRLTPTSTDPYRFTQSGGWELFFEVQLSWKLDRLLFSTAELGIERLRRARALAQARLAERVLRLLFTWQRARIRLHQPGLLPEERAAAVVQQAEAEAMLNVFTGGWFAGQQSD